MLAAFDIKKARNNTNTVNKKKYDSELAKFMKDGFAKFDLTQKEFNLQVVRGDVVEDWGADLGTTIFKLSNSRTLKIKNHSIINGKQNIFALNMENRSNGSEVSYRFAITEKFIILKSVEAEGTEITDSKAMAALILGVQ